MIRARVLEYSYNEEKHIIFWKVVDVDTGQERQVCFRANDIIGAMLNLQVEVSADIAIQFCEQMRDRDDPFNLDMQAAIQNVSEGDLSEEEVKTIIKELDNYPYEELTDTLIGDEE